MNSFQILVDNELVTIVFKSLSVGLKIAKQLQNSKDLNINTEQIKKLPENDTSATEIQAVKNENSSTAQKTPLDEQLEQMRTILAAQDQKQLKEMLQLQSTQLQQIMQTQMSSNSSIPTFLTQPQAGYPALPSKPPIHPPSGLPAIPVLSPMTGSGFAPSFQQKQFQQGPPGAYLSGAQGQPAMPPLEVVKQKIQEYHQQIQKTYEYMLVQLFSSRPSRLVEYANMMNMPQETIQSRDQVMSIVQRISEQLIQTQTVDALMAQLRDNENLDAKTKQSLLDLMTQLKTYMHYYQVYQEQGARDKKQSLEGQRPLSDVQKPPNLPGTFGFPGGFKPPQAPYSDAKKPMSSPTFINNVPIPAMPRPYAPQRPAGTEAPRWAESASGAAEAPQRHSVIQAMRELASSKEYRQNQNLAVNILAQIAPQQVSRLLNPSGLVATLDRFGRAQRSVNQFVKESPLVASESKKEASDGTEAPNGIKTSQGGVETAQEVSKSGSEGNEEVGETSESREDAWEGQAAREPFRQLLERYLASDLASTQEAREARSELASKLLQVESFFANHERFLAQQPLRRFHGGFTPYENLALLTLALPPDITCFQKIRESAVTVVQCDIFAKLNKLVREKATPVSGAVSGSVIGTQNTVQTATGGVQGGPQIGPGSHVGPVVVPGAPTTFAPSAPVSQGSQSGQPIQGYNQPQSVQSALQNQVYAIPISKEQTQGPPLLNGGAPLKFEGNQGKLSASKEMEMCNSFKEQVIDLGKKILPFVSSSVMIPCIVMILGVGDELDLDVTEGMRFFKSNINRVFHDNAAAFHENMEKVFILAITIIEAVFGVMRARQGATKARPLMYRAQVPLPDGDGTGYKTEYDDAPQFTEFLAHYLKIIQAIKDGRRLDESSLGNYYFLNEADIHTILGGHNYTDIDAVVEALAIDTNAISAYIIEKKVSTGFGVDRSETDSDDM